MSNTNSPREQEHTEDPRDLLWITPDIPSQDLKSTAEQMGKRHLALQDVPGKLPVALTMCAGVMGGCFVFSRPDTDTHVNAVCVVKTASTNSYLSHDVIKLLGYSGTAREYRIKCQGEELTFLKRQTPEATSIIGVNFINRHKLTWGYGSGFMFDNKEDLPLRRVDNIG